MKRRYLFLLVALAIAFAGLVSAPPAKAAPQHNYCVWRYYKKSSWDASVKYEVWRWNKSPRINVYLHSNWCPKNSTHVKIYIKNLDRQYAALANRYAYYIKLNSDYNYYTRAQKNSIVGHELGHIFKFSHTSWGIMHRKPYNSQGPSQWFLNRAR